MNVSHFTVIYDACVLYPAPLRSLLMYLAMTDLFRARWTEAIHEEWMRNVQKGYPDITRQQVERIRDLIFTDWQEADQAWGTYQSFPAAWPEIFVLWWNPGATTATPSTLQIRLFPVPAQAGNLNVLYYRQVVLAANEI